MPEQSTKPEGSQHTPGPWRFELKDCSIEGQPRAFVGYIYAPAAAGRAWEREVAVLYGQLDEERAANGAVIAAAPDLYEALKDTLVYWEATGFAKCDEGCECLVEQVRAAIAKAEGKAVADVR